MEEFAPYAFDLLQIIGTGLTAWVLVAIVAVRERVVKMEVKLDTIPLEQIAHNRHRIENLEKAVDRVDMRMTSMEKRCSFLHKDD